MTIIVADRYLQGIFAPKGNFYILGIEMSGGEVVAASGKLVPSVPESGSPPVTRRVRLSKVLAAQRVEKSARKHSPAKQSKRDEATPAKGKLKTKRYTIPESEYAQLTALKKRLLAMGVTARKSQLLRAGLLLLVTMSDTRLKRAVEKPEFAAPLPPKVTKNA